MRSPSFKRALRATIRACVVAISASNVAYADWNASLVSIPASCVVHDSGMEFLPLRFRAIAELDAFAESLPSGNAPFELNGPVETVREVATDHCVLAAVRHANYERLFSYIDWARNQASWFYSAANEWIDNYPVMPTSWNRAIRSNSPFIARMIVNALEKTGAPSERGGDQVLHVDNRLAALETVDSDPLPWDCDQNHGCAKYLLQRELTDADSKSELAQSASDPIFSPSDLGNTDFGSYASGDGEVDTDMFADAEQGIGALPSGYPANIFVFSLQNSDLSDDQLRLDQQNASTGESEAFDELADRSLSAALASRTGRSAGESVTDAFDGEFCSQLVSGTEVDAPIIDNRFPIEEGCIPNDEYLPAVLSDSLTSDEEAGTPAIVDAPEYLFKTLKDGGAAVSMVPDQIGIDSKRDRVIPESELCLPLASSGGSGYDPIASEDTFANSIEPDSSVPSGIPIDPALNLGLGESNESWRSLFRPHGCIFAPEYLIDQPSVGIRSSTEIEPDPVSEDISPIAPKASMNRDLSAVDAALRDPIGIGLELSAAGTRWSRTEIEDPEIQTAIVSESVRWSDSAWVGYANDIAANGSVQGMDDVTEAPLTKIFAQGLRRFGDWMVQWSDALEMQIRMAEGSDRGTTHDR